MYARTGTHAVKCGIHSGANSCVIQGVSAAAYGILSWAKTYLLPTSLFPSPIHTHKHTHPHREACHPSYDAQSEKPALNKRGCDHIRVALLKCYWEQQLQTLGRFPLTVLHKCGTIGSLLSQLLLLFCFNRLSLWAIIPMIVNWCANT